jgi:hypothetical protein
VGPASVGILWALDARQSSPKNSTQPAILRAFRADNLAQLYCSCTNATRDAPDRGVKFNVPTVVNGKVYIAGATALTVYGLF